MENIISTMKHYDILIDENNDPVYDTKPLQEYMDKWDGNKFLNELKISNDSSVLEIGVGTGRLALKILKQGCNESEFERGDFTMKNLKVALLQLMPEGTLDGNLQKGLKYCRKSKEMGADIALFPEMWSVGYNIPEDIAELKANAVFADSAFVNSFGNLAKDLNMAIGITFLEKYDLLPRNTLCLFDRFGNNVLTYAKVHTCDFGDECRITAGNDFYVAGLDTEQGNVKIGAMICYDREFPESARILMLKGAEIILVPNACPMEINRISQLRARAYENMVGIATVNYPKGKPDCNGHSSAFDGIAYRPSDLGSRDTLIMEAGEREGIYIADFPIDGIREYRSREVHGNAYRHPQKYKLLISECIEEPFIRKDYRK